VFLSGSWKETTFTPWLAGRDMYKT